MGISADNVICIVLRVAGSLRAPVVRNERAFPTVPWQLPFGKMATALLAVFCGGVCSSAPAHPVPSAVARVVLNDEGELEIVLTADVSAFVLEGMQGHLEPERIDELKTMPAEELYRRAEAARRAFQRQMTILIDSQRQAIEVEFPSLESIRRAAPHGRPPQQRIIVRGRAPLAARELALSFPVDIGLVEVEISRGDLVLGRQRLKAGQTSKPFRLTKTASNDRSAQPAARRPAIALGLLLGLVVLLGLFRLFRR